MKFASVGSRMANMSEHAQYHKRARMEDRRVALLALRFTGL
jgi:hypothetical protein